MNTWIIIGVVCAIISLLYKAINIPQIQPRTLKVIVVWIGRRVPKFIGIAFISVLSAACIFTIYASTRVPCQFELILVDVLMVWAIIGMWSPFIQRKYEKSKKPFEIINIVLFIFVLAGFWKTQWPQWRTPAILTFVVLTFAFFYLHTRLLKKEKHVTQDK